MPNKPMSLRAAAAVIAVSAAVFGGGCNGCGPQPGTLTRGDGEHTQFPIAGDAVHAIDRATDDGPVSCVSCHGTTQAFTQFSCVGCHAHEPVATDLLHTTVPAYAYDSGRCYSCHKEGVQRPIFDHASGREQCATCHQEGAAFHALPVDNFTHPATYGTDCGSCHFSVVDWTDTAVPLGLASDPVKNLEVSALLPQYAGTSIVSVTPSLQSLPMNMNHFTDQVEPEVMAACANCHTNADTYYPGRLHSSISNLFGAAPTQCAGCHAASVPSGFVGPLATDPPRDPATGEMKHDAVVWLADAPTATAIVTLECATCHQPPTQARNATWAVGDAPTQFHPSLDDAALAQPDSCIDCHANSRPNAVFTSADAPMPAGVTFDHATAEAQTDCISCHSSALVTPVASWTDGRFHSTNAPTPSSCLPCHEGQRPTSDADWQNPTYETAPFDYGTNSVGITHGAGQDCVSCHANPGTGAWGINQNWRAGSYDHAPGTTADHTCIACHSAQRADLVVSNAAALLGFDHATSGAGDCVGCHQASVVAGTYSRFFNAGGALPGGDWQGGVTYPGPFPIGSLTQFITLDELILSRSGALNLVTGTTPTTEVIYNQMVHTAVALPPELNAGTQADATTCWHCHTNVNGNVTTLIDGQYHASLDSFRATFGAALSPRPQPTSNCKECHAAPAASRVLQGASIDLQPMDHGALFTTAVNIGGQSVSNVGAMDCSSCHAGPGTSWADGRFHANIAAATPQDCTACHYVTMANTLASDAVVGANAMRHKSVQVREQNCQTCHTDALGRAAQTPIAFAQWTGATLHPHVTTQPTACVECHAAGVPAGLTQSSVTYTLPQGATATNGRQWMTHADNNVVGQDCVRCHAADARTSGSAWSNSTALHARVPSVVACTTCHGTGTAGGAQNNLPSGLTDTITVTSSAGVSGTGIAAGTRDQISHADLNVARNDCVMCHTQNGPSVAAGVVGREWAQASFHSKFTGANPLTLNDTSGRCSNCHLNVKPGTGYSVDHSTFTAVSGSVDCSSCHSWPGTGGVSAPSWGGATGGAPSLIAVGGFLVPEPPAPNATTIVLPIPNLPHPAVATGTACTLCHGAAGGGKNAIGYDHGSVLINNKCSSCHEAGSNLVGSVWNDANSVAAGAGDTRPFTLVSLDASTAVYPGRTLTVTAPNHFYGTDCYECHDAYEGALSTATTGVAYTAAWSFPHDQSRMTNPTTCVQCHGEGGVLPADLVNDPLTSVDVNTLVPSYSGTSVSRLDAVVQTMPMPMDHLTTAMDPGVMTNCAACHAEPQTLYPGKLHSSLANLRLGNPTACVDCHFTSRPTGFVGPLATDPPRNPASGEMKHDAVAWLNDAPTVSGLVPVECSTCHVAPSQALPTTWAVGSAPAVFHASITNAGLPQPDSCIDCHANSRAEITYTTANAPSLPAGVTFDHTLASAQTDCTACHQSTTYTSWADARFHSPGDATPSSCLPCHSGERPTSTASWLSTTFRTAPFDFVTNASGITHGDGQDCVMCHASSGTGTWGVNQNWQGGAFSHAAGTVADTTCIACHSTQRADRVGVANVATLLGFDHVTQGTGDCLGCHQASIDQAAFSRLFNAGGTLPGGDWQGGISYPGSVRIGSQTNFIQVAETTLVRSGALNLVTSTTTSTATLYNEMLHTSAALPASLNAGPSGAPDDTKCWHCHTNNNGLVTSFLDGQYHTALTNFKNTPGGATSPIAQPTTVCLDCHTQMYPLHIVERAASYLEPMDHSAAFTTAVNIGGKSVTSVTGVECAVCHRSPGTSWADGKFHANIGAATPLDCNTCHYVTMANTAVADLTTNTNKMKHASLQVKSQNCRSCHTAALARGAQTPIVPTLWAGGLLHPTSTPQPTACLDCHAASVPAVSTKGTVNYTFAQGGTASNSGQWMRHTTSYVSGRDCVQCHAADAKTAGSAWNKSAPFHATTTAVTTCATCHGLTNGMGTVVGTNNNMPLGLNDSSMLSSVAGVGTVGVPAGTKAQIAHTDANVTTHDCNLCHTQVGASAVAAVTGKEWAQAKFHNSFNAATPLLLNGSSARCSNCHMNLRPGAGFSVDHSAYTNVAGSTDCSSCHSWPGTGTAAAPNWLGAAGGFPPIIAVGGFLITSPPAANATTTQVGIANLPHPTPGANACTACHLTAGGGKDATGYDHLSTLSNQKCASCHEAGSNLVGTKWNGATAIVGAGDTRPFTIATIRATFKGNSRNVTSNGHFFPTDCYQCHNKPTGVAHVTTGTTYTTAWKFPHTENKMTNPATCALCHGNNIPN